MERIKYILIRKLLKMIISYDDIKLEIMQIELDARFLINHILTIIAAYFMTGL